MCGGSEDGGRGRRERLDLFAEKVCHKGGGNLKGLGVNWVWVMEWYSGKIELERTTFKIMRNLEVLASFNGFVVAGMESVCGDMGVK